ncbi:MAG: tetratricopeptide repeat protein [Methylomonas sp.]|jgi:tetratricopeptide (TPR) repeat protein
MKDNRKLFQVRLLERVNELFKNGRYQDVITLIEGTQIKNIQAYNVAGICAVQLRLMKKAEFFFREVVSLNPDLAEAHNNLGNALKELKRFDEAKECYLKALSLNSCAEKSYHNLGLILKEQRRYDEAEHYYRQALLIKPDYAEAELGMSELLLTRGKFEEGWKLHEARYKRYGAASIKNTRAPIHLPFPQWQGQALTGKSILLWKEQGHGDEIQFCRYTSELKKLGAKRITLVCKEPLRKLFMSLDNVDLVTAEDEVDKIPAHDFWTLLLSLPLFCETRLNNIPADLPYLYASATQVEHWKTRIPATGFRIGLVWKGASGHKNDANRSIPSLKHLAPLWSIPGAVFISLQKENGEEEALSPPAGQSLIVLGTDINDFSDTAAIITLLDLVISVDTAIAHLAGALNKPCWVLLPAVGTDWRWLHDRKDSPWYPKIMRLFKQEAVDDWESVVGKAAHELERMLQTYG